MTRSVEWFLKNPVAANLTMIVIIVGGLVTLLGGGLKVETFPEFSLDRITITVPYLGAAPEEVEEGVCIRIEEAIQGLDGVKKVESTANEGIATVMVELLPGEDMSRVLDDVKSRVDAIETFPEEIEEPVISEVTQVRAVLNVAVYGPADEPSIKKIGERVRDDLAAIEGITLVELAAARPYEISIEVSEEALRRHGISFDFVAGAVRRSSLDLPGGSIKTGGGEILLRTKGQAYRGPEFESLVLLTRADGSRLTLGEVATVVDGFEDTDQASTFDGQPSVQVKVFRVGDQSALDVAAKVRTYIEENESRLPEGISLAIWQDMSKVLRDRLSLLIRNGVAGFCLVFLLLALFLRMRLAAWTSLGIAISFMGGILLMPTLDVSINLISLFAFILVLGIVVDDAIVVGESIYTHQHKGAGGFGGALKGAKVVGVPVVFAVLTTVAAFSPLLNVQGATGKIMRVIPLIVIPTLLFSLVESLWILPAHLRHYSGDRKKRQAVNPVLILLRTVQAGWHRFQGAFARGLERFIERAYKPSLDLALRKRYLTLAVGLATLICTFGLVGGGYIKFVFFPDVEADFVTATLTMPQGTPVDVTEAAVRRIEAAALEAQREVDATTEDGAPSVVLHALASIGGQPVSDIVASNAGGMARSTVGSHYGEYAIELSPSEERELASTEFVNIWREKVGAIPDAVELSFSSSLFSPGEAINIQLAGPSVEELREAAVRLKEALAGYPGAYNVADSYRAGKQEVKLSILPQAETLGLSQSDLGRQVRRAFYGEEAQRIQRGRDDIRVMVRYPESERRSLGDLDEMRIRTAAGDEVPFATVADAELGRGYASIRRVDRFRVVNVTASVDDTKGNPNEIIAALEATTLPELMGDYAGLRYDLEGQSREQAETLQSLRRGFVIALFVIFALMAIPFRSYVQPAIVMSAIPFGVVGAVWGHVLMGKNLTILSVFGVIALAGVVVNDSLVMVDYINKRRAEGLSLGEAVRVAGAARFRPILLTSLTTFAGLTPLLLERSMQAQFLIPLGISLGFGVIFATFVTLVLVPSSYMILEDIGRFFRWLYGSGTKASDEETAPVVEQEGAHAA